jgi:hypothetical protein
MEINLKFKKYTEIKPEKDSICLFIVFNSTAQHWTGSIMKYDNPFKLNRDDVLHWDYFYIQPERSKREDHE